MAACSSGADDQAQGGLPKAPNGSGYCCPVSNVGSCGCVETGGWTATNSLASCHGCLWDLAPPAQKLTVDEHGCPFVQQISNESCLIPADVVDTASDATAAEE